MSEIKEKFHPALSITNVKSVFPITLDNETEQYHSWAALFKVQLRVHNLLEHIHPPTEAKEKEIYEAKKAADPELWRRLDATVLQWIYSTISPDLLHAILFKDDSAKAAWVRLEGIFRDNKGSRATHLEEELAAVDFANFSSIDAYCNHVKSLADRLADVDAHATNIVSFLNSREGYRRLTLGSRFKLRERTIKSVAAKEGGGTVALLATANGNQPLDDGHSPNTAGRNNNNHSKNKKKNYGRGNYQSNRGRNNGGGATNGVGNSVFATNPQQPRPWQWQTPWGNWAQQQWGAPWAIPPCPFPSSPWQQQPRKNYPNRASRVLGPRPQQAYTAYYAPSNAEYIPTDVETAMHTMSLSQPDGNYYMDTGATSHMMADQGIFSSYFNSSNNHHHIVVGNGHLIPIIGYGSTSLSKPHPPLSLNNMLHAPKLIKNLISVRKFTTDNSVSVEFDPFGFSLNDLQTGTKIMRCDSMGDPYPIFSNNQPTKSFSPSNLTTLSSTL
ncbi:uncharacterized protein [Primulina eburnea]|uniref:uncharacterized protein n=1 Tax=Primulina eburnea TaxID=1245227 RepID=UPI003C6BDDA1